MKKNYHHLKIQHGKIFLFNNLTRNKPINNKAQSSRQVRTALLHISEVLHLSSNILT